MIRSRRLNFVAAGVLFIGALTVAAPAQAAPAFVDFSTSYRGPLDVGDAVDLTWDVSGAQDLTASGDWSGSRPVTGDEEVTLVEGINTFTLTANEGLQDELSQTIKVVAGVDVQARAGACQSIVATNNSAFTVRFSYGPVDEILSSEPAQPVLAPGETSEQLPFPYDVTDVSAAYEFAVRDTDGSFVPAFQPQDGLDYPRISGIVACDDDAGAGGAGSAGIPTAAPAAGL